MGEEDGLLFLTEAGIQARCNQASFERGRSYYYGGAVIRRFRTETGLEAQVEGTFPYQVKVWSVGGEVRASCTCPYDYGGECKHIVAVLLAWLHEPESFLPPPDIRAILNRHTKAQLVDLLADIIDLYPHLLAEFQVEGGLPDNKLLEQVKTLFDELQPNGSLGEEEGERRMRLIARRADRLIERGRTDLARQVYYALLSGCLRMNKSYGTDEFFSIEMIYDFAVSYDALAAAQVSHRGKAIKAELEELYEGLSNPDRWDLDDALSNTAFELMDQGFE